MTVSYRLHGYILIPGIDGQLNMMPEQIAAKIWFSMSVLTARTHWVATFPGVKN